MKNEPAVPLVLPPGLDGTGELFEAFALAQASPAVLAHWLQLIAARHSFRRTLGDTPCRYLRAAQDRLVPATASRWFAQHLPNFRLQVAEGPHVLLQARPQPGAPLTAAIARGIGGRAPA